jgi:hypothetical protein
MATAAALAAAGLYLTAGIASAQDRAPGEGRQTGAREGRRGPGDRGDRGDRMGGRFDPERMREMMVERLREPLDVTDAEWNAIKPLVADVVEKQSAERRMGSRFGRMGRRGGPGGDRGPEVAAEDQSPAEQLETVLEKENASAEEIKAKLKALRDARKKAEEELKQAREKLRQVLTVRQEARLVLMGMLD